MSAQVHWCPYYKTTFMPNKRLTPKEEGELKSMVIRGVAPEDIAQHFDIAISSVHNHKRKLKNEGTTFPSVRGKRPTGSIAPIIETHFAGTKPMAKLKPINTASDSNNYSVTLNGTHIEISSRAKEIKITERGVEVNF